MCNYFLTPFLTILSITANCFGLGKAIADGCPRGCSCRYDPISVKNMMIDCQGSGLTALPNQLPPASRYQLHLDGNYISQIQAVPYLWQINYLDMSNNLIDIITPDAWDILNRNVRFLYLNNNKFKQLPLTNIEEDLKYVTEIRLSQNPWTCNCSNDIFTAWLEKRDNIADIEHIICHQLDSGETVNQCHPVQRKVDNWTTENTGPQKEKPEENETLHKQIIVSFAAILLTVCFVYTTVIFLHFYLQKRKALRVKQLTDYLHQTLPPFGPPASPLLDHRQIPP